MSATLDVLAWGLVEESEAATTKTSAQRGFGGGHRASVSEYVVAVPPLDLPSPPRVVTVHVARWIAASEIESQTTVARRYAARGVWLPPPTVASPAVGEFEQFEETVIADPMALAAMDEAEQRLSAARDAEVDREREDRLYYRD